MSATTPAAPQTVTLYTRLLLTAVIVLVFIAGVQLYVLSAYTDRFFAWTIALPLSAALIGAGFWSAAIPTAITFFQPHWLDFRSSLVPAMTATTLVLLSTLLHLDKFHFGSEAIIPKLAAWVWLLVYLVVPPALILGWVVQFVSPGQNRPARKDLPLWLRLVLLGQALLTLTAGAALFLLPDLLMPAWGWPLTPLTARMTAAWIMAYGVGAVAILFENDLRRVRGEMAGLLAFGVLQLLALVRFAGSVDWGQLSTLLYLLFLVSVIAANGLGLLARPRPA